jgi:sugar phosphate isomerase/epimerase
VPAPAPVARRPPVGVSTGVYSQFPDHATPEAVADGMERLGAEVYEVLLFGSWKDARAAARTIAAVRRPVAVVHGEKRVGGLLGSADAGERRLGQELLLAAVDAAVVLGAPCVNVHVWDLPDSDRHLERNLDALGEVLPAVWQRGVHLLAETIPCQQDVPWRNVQRILEFADDLARAVPGAIPPGGEAIGVNLDLEFLSWHDGLDLALAEYAPRWGARLRNVHVKDHDGRPFGPDGRRRYVNPGDGRLDYLSIFGRLRAAGYAGPLTFEGRPGRHPPLPGPHHGVGGRRVGRRRRGVRGLSRAGTAAAGAPGGRPRRTAPAGTRGAPGAP